jgi:hypothetical protein
MGFAFLATLLVVAVQCGPSQQELAGGVLIGSPIALALGVLVVAGLYARVRSRCPGVRWHRTPAFVGLGLSVATALTTAVALSGTNVFRVALYVLWFFSTSYLSLLVLTWWVWARNGHLESALAWSWLPAAVLQCVPAVLVAAQVMPADPVGVVWFWPGLFGLSTLSLLWIAYAEAGRSRTSS